MSYFLQFWVSPPSTAENQVDTESAFDLRRPYLDQF
ncbi:hypothetical protein PCC7805_00527 [Planktothrix agardhii]|uniref:Uncharacterized protein n=1 Tax=Planktothrix agardhii TaxID=1160 RepID=A0AAD1Q2C2_PLAAG|nr:hypothetical protein NIES204_29090 [Planktothrix agardhii NIES-204]CAD5918881.1 hypothetical protein PCC7805_00527 [Planktothrix agardhii]CAD5925034.1 hypothetical protein NO365_00918 [Planktothrix agardhii]CAD5947495.1 hypothetical protein PANO66_02391 [Planktothrix agardhii]CAD5952071.1 hypothetical protein NO2A_03079 [Planktothrix agardhii]